MPPSNLQLTTKPILTVIKKNTKLHSYQYLLLNPKHSSQLTDDAAQRQNSGKDNRVWADYLNAANVMLKQTNYAPK